MRPTIFVVLSVLPFGTTLAQEPPPEGVVRVEVPLGTPKKDSKRAEKPLDRALFDLWLPDGVETVRGVVVNPFYRGATGQRHWRAACRHWRFGLVATNYFGIKSEDFGTLATAMDEFAEATGHEELSNAPFLFVGMSAGGGMSTRLTELFPERTIAAAPVCLEVGPRDAASRRVPMITMFGEKDGKQLERLFAKLPVERGKGALWALGIQWGRRHEFGQANNLIMPFFDAVVAARYPPELSPARGPVKLKPVDPVAAGWLGHCDRWTSTPAPISMAGYFDGDATMTAWLPDESVAHTWQAFVAREKALQIDVPAGLGDGQTFVVHEAGKPITVRFRVRGRAKPRSVRLFDGARPLAEFEGATVTIDGLQPGIHALHVRGETAEGTPLLSRPHTIIVREQPVRP